MSIVCLHGWSDNHHSLLPLADYISKQQNKSVQHLWLSNYLSLDDALQFSDLASAMMQAWQQQGLSLAPNSVDVVVHSMGALVLRFWLQQYFSADEIPIRRCVMLAPANFGSALAHKGQAWLGRVFKGLHYPKTFQVGSQLLQDMEVGSPALWQLAEQDCFLKPIFHPKTILTTILIGSEGYSGLAAMVNEPGSDGVIRWSAANLEPVSMQMSFAHRPVITDTKKSKNHTAFCLMPDCNHHTILCDTQQQVNTQVAKAVMSGLTVTAETFDAWHKHCQTQVKAHLSQLPMKQQCQQMWLYVENQFNKPVDDYVFLATIKQDDMHHLTDYFQTSVQLNAHVIHSQPAYRCLYWSTGCFWQSETAWQDVHFSLMASPQFNPPNMLVGYDECSIQPHAAWQIQKGQFEHLMTANRTYFINIQVPRQQADLFDLLSYQKNDKAT